MKFIIDIKPSIDRPNRFIWVVEWVQEYTSKTAIGKNTYGDVHSAKVDAEAYAQAVAKAVDKTTRYEYEV